MGVTQDQRVAEVGSLGDRALVGAVEEGAQRGTEPAREPVSERLTERLTERLENQGPTCPRCGGSGTLRHGDQRYRTCLDCLGQGLLLTVVGGSLRPTRRISSVVSVSRAG